MSSQRATVSLVIPGRNVAGTIRPCLEAVAPLLNAGKLLEILFIDDGSTDATREIVAEFPVRCIAGSGRGAGAARNLGWRAAQGNLVWFVDADCVAEPDALDRLLPHLDDPRVGGVSGSYGNMRSDSLLACLIHEEIIDRHLRMAPRVNFAATFNVLYRRDVLEQVGGFDERYLKGQDAELSWRVLAAGYELAFEIESRVRHFHEDRWRSYLRTQRQQGYWRVFLHLNHRGHARGDSYSGLLDHVQPPLAMLALVTLPLLLVPWLRIVPPALFLLLAALQVPLTARLVRRTGRWRYAAFIPFGFLRAFWRGLGMSRAMLPALRGRRAFSDVDAGRGDTEAAVGVAGGAGARGEQIATATADASMPPRKSGLRLAYVTPAFPWRSHVFEQNEVVGLSEAGHDVRLLSCIRPPAQEFAAVHAFARPLLERASHPSAAGLLRGVASCLMLRPVRTLQTAGDALRFTMQNPARWRPQLGVWAVAAGFVPYLRRTGCDWIHADFAAGSATVAWYLSRWLDRPLSFKAHAYDIYSEDPAERDPTELLRRKCAAATVVFCVSRFGADHLVRRVGEDVRRKIVVHRVGVRLNGLPELPAAAAERVATEDAPMEDDGASAAAQRAKIVALGRLVEKKGFDRLIDAVALLRQRGCAVDCEIYGEGPLREALAAAVAQRGLEGHVALLGAYAHEALPEMLRDAALVVVPSVTARSGDMDGVPTVIYEAMALGRPVVASAISGIPEVIEPGRTGWLVPPGDVPALADAIEDALRDRAAAARVAEAALAYVRAAHDARMLGAELGERLSRHEAGLSGCEATILPN